MSVYSSGRMLRHLCTWLAVAACLAAAPGAVSQAASGKLITLDAEDAYLPSVLKILGEKGDLNVISGPGVTGARLSIHMRDVPVEQAVDLVVRAAGLSYERIGNSILVADARSLKEEAGRSSYVVELKYADATDVQAALKDLAATVQVEAKTGVEMEALTAVATAALTVYDMCKSVDRGITIHDIQLEEKSGGRSGHWQRETIS